MKLKDANISSLSLISCFYAITISFIIETLGGGSNMDIFKLVKKI